LANLVNLKFAQKLALNAYFLLIHEFRQDFGALSISLIITSNSALILSSTLTHLASALMHAARGGAASTAPRIMRRNCSRLLLVLSEIIGKWAHHPFAD